MPSTLYNKVPKYLLNKHIVPISPAVPVVDTVLRKTANSSWSEKKGRQHVVWQLLGQTYAGAEGTWGRGTSQNTVAKGLQKTGQAGFEGYIH